MHEIHPSVTSIRHLVDVTDGCILQTVINRAAREDCEYMKNIAAYLSERSTDSNFTIQLVELVMLLVPRFRNR
jgi:hypothetical protein